MIDHDSPVPVYRQLVDILRGQIERGELAPDRPIPSVAQLVGTYGIARGTAVKAVQVLVRDGLAYTVTGKGTYVRRREATSET
ncbi:GntR family transcriptional regulator [Plantactinospora endophytica]|nr:GntR family transcriptional regulator [Plantactinospora endophytica]